MKIAYCSDLHLEFGDLILTNTEQADILVLSGDICIAATLRDKDIEFNISNRYHNFFENCCKQFPTVIYIMGNHEHYHGDFAKTYNILKTYLKYLPNLHILEKEILKIDDVTFIGGTLWTDMNDSDSLTLFNAKGMISDFNIIKNSNHVVYHNVPLYEEDENGNFKKDAKGYKNQIGVKKGPKRGQFLPEDSVEEHHKMMDYIKHVLKKEQKYVICGHHTPSWKSCHEKYINDKLMNGAYHSELSEFILDRPEIKLWIHGHTHENFDYMIGDTRIVCNTRGYDGVEKRAKSFELKYIEI
jgi:hypothetical protein